MQTSLQIFFAKTKIAVWTATLLLCSITIASGQKKQQPRPAEKKFIQFAGGYVQSIWQLGNNVEQFKVGKNLHPNRFESRMGIRRGYLNFAAGYKDLSAMAIINVQDFRLVPYAIYLKYAPHQLNGFYLKTGLDKVYFGLDLPSSSAKRPFFDRSIYVSELFPGDHDLGLTLGYASPDKQATQGGIALGLMSGNGGQRMTKPIPDFLFRGEVVHHLRNLSLSFGVSGYYGFVAQPGTDKYLNRIYYGTHATLEWRHGFGLLSLSGEAIAGKQVGTDQSTMAYATIDPTRMQTVQRPFVGVMGAIVERFDVLPIEWIARYNYYNRNTNYTASSAEQTLGGNSLNRISHTLLTGFNCYSFNNRVRWSVHYEAMYNQDGFTPNGAVRFGSSPLHLGTVGLQYTF
ncbi:MAG: hypothetical protein SPI35_07575 [Porphyromonas sp.]|nr:hypothetical protein [Porphyromonas sp.]